MSKLIKHRGLHNALIKENTYDAIKMALNDNKYLGVEFDVRETKDHEFVIYHNPSINNKLISNTNFNNLPKFIPRLKDILKLNSNKIFLIEIKNINSFTKFYNLLNKFKNKKLYVMSFSSRLIDKVNIPNRAYKIGILNYILNTNKDIKKLDFIAILDNFLDQNIINKLNGLEIFSYGIIEEVSQLKYPEVYYIVDN